MLLWTSRASAYCSTGWRSCRTIRPVSSTSSSTPRVNNDMNLPVREEKGSIYALAARLPKAGQKLRFTSIPYESEHPIYPEPLSRRGAGSPAVQRSNPDNPNWPVTAWSCQYFSLNATPPSPSPTTTSKGRSRKPAFPSPFPKTIPPKTRRDFGEPSLAFDHIVLQDKAISPEDKAVVRAENKKQKPYTMSLTIRVSKKKINKLASVRNKIRKRLTAAIRLVVQSGISPDLVHSFQRKAVTGPAHHLLPGHKYTMQTSLELYRMPMDQLVPLVAEALRKIYVLGSKQLVDQACEEECSLEQAKLDQGQGTNLEEEQDML